MKSLFAMILLCAFCPAWASASTWPCLPTDVTEDTLVSGQQLEAAKGKTPGPVTVGEVLRRIDADCRNGKLYDKTGREIHFFHLVGCWGNPPADYQEQLAAQAQEIERLKKQYTVLEIPCEPMDPRQIY